MTLENQFFSAIQGKYMHFVDRHGLSNLFLEEDEKVERWFNPTPAQNVLPLYCLVPQVRVRSLDASPSTSSGQALGGGTLGLVPRRFLLPDLSLSTPIRSRLFRFLAKHSGESCSTSTLLVLL
jgi:hypothetical protein